jgi:hypothetical protein
MITQLPRLARMQLMHNPKIKGPAMLSDVATMPPLSCKVVYALIAFAANAIRGQAVPLMTARLEDLKPDALAASPRLA